MIGSFITTFLLVHHVLWRVFEKTSSHPGDSVPLLPRFGALWLLAFPKTKSPLKGKRFQTNNGIQGNMMGQLIAIGTIVWGPNVLTLNGSEVSLFYVQCFLYLVFSSINVSIFHMTWLVLSGQPSYTWIIEVAEVERWIWGEIYWC